MTADQVAVPVRAPVWPVLISPVVAGLYYLAVRWAFAQSIVAVLGRSDFFDLSTPRWGSHWIYRAAAEVIAAGVGTFVAAGLTFGRERAAAIVGGCTISVGFIIKLAITYFIWNEQRTDLVLEPWYQYAIDAAMIIAAPIIGVYVVEPAEDMHRNTPNGFGGINRLHFVWLWIAAFWYALGLITPLTRIYALRDDSIIATFILLLINGIPAAAIAIPGYYGLTFLAGQHGSTMHPAGRNLVGSLVLIFGFLVGAVVQGGWYWLMQTIHDSIFG